MSIDNVKKISVEVSIDCWKVLKKTSIDKDIHLVKLIREILESCTKGKKYKVIETNETVIN